jgi:hypothetical protein
MPDNGAFHHSLRFLEVTMKTKSIGAVLIAMSASLAAPAFASGYGPAPFYNPEVGAPSSQRGLSPQSIRADQYRPADTKHDDGSMGGTVESPSQSGGGVQLGVDALYRGH